MIEIPDLVDAVACVDEIERLERAKTAACARQAELAARLASLDPQASARSMGAHVAMARHESPHRGRRLLSLALALVRHHPEVLRRLEIGEINEHRAELICTETQDLDPEQRRAVDREIVRVLDDHPTAGDLTVQHATRRIVQRIDHDGATRRREAALSRRHLASRVLGDGLAQVSGTIADHEMAAIMHSLSERAEVLRATGCDDRTRAQIMADLFVERLTGQATATSVPITIDLVVSAETLLAEGLEPGELPGVGPIPAEIARRLVQASPAESTKVRRLFADTDHLVAMESAARHFDGLLRRFVTLRDRRCRTPWCEAPIRHADHVTAHADGGPTSLHNGQGLCEACNLTKEESGWTHHTVSADVVEAHQVEVTTPTGHCHRSRAPAPPGTDPRDAFVETRPGLWTLIV